MDRQVERAERVGGTGQRRFQQLGRGAVEGAGGIGTGRTTARATAVGVGVVTMSDHIGPLMSHPAYRFAP